MTMKNRTISLQRIEEELAAGNITCRAPNGNYWSVRRNGATKIWVTCPGEFHIPVKVGFRNFAVINHCTRFCRPGDPTEDFMLMSMA